MADELLDVAHAILHGGVVHLFEFEPPSGEAIGPRCRVKLRDQGGQRGGTDIRVRVAVIDRAPPAGDAIILPAVGAVQHVQQFLPADFVIADGIADRLQAALPDRHDHRGQRRRANVGQVKNFAPRLQVRQRQPVTNGGLEDHGLGDVGVVRRDDGINNALHDRTG